MKPLKYMFDGELRSVKEIAERTGLSHTMVRKRLQERDGDAETAIRASVPHPRKLHMYQGEMLSVSDISRRSGVNLSTLVARMTRYGYDAETAVRAIMAGRGSRHMYKGKRKTLEQISMDCGVSVDKLYRRIHVHGVSADEAADPNYAGLRYTLNGERISLQNAARRSALPIADIRARIAKEGYPSTLDQIVAALKRERRMLRPEVVPVQAGEEKRKPPGAEFARDILSRLFPANVVMEDMKAIFEAKLYRIERDILDYDVIFDKTGGARLVVTDRTTRHVWFDRSF